MKCVKIYHDVDVVSVGGGRSACASELVLVSVVVELVSVAAALVLVAIEIFTMCSPGTIAMPKVLRLRSWPPVRQDSTCSVEQVTRT